MRREVIFISSALLSVLLVPVVSGLSIVGDACAALRASPADATCTGDKFGKKGETCCWRTKVEGSLLGKTWCQTCKVYTDSKGEQYEKCERATLQAIKSPEAGQSGPQLGGVLEEPKINQSAGGLLGLATENNLTFSQTNITSDSSNSNDSNSNMQTAQSDLEPEEQANNSIKQKKTIDKGEDVASQEQVEEDVPNNLKIPNEDNN
jgi:hypothetical protein